MLTRLVVTAVAMLVSIPGSAQAQDAKKPPPPSEFTADLSFVSVMGNTSTTTLAADEKYIRRTGKWEFRQEFGAVYGKTDGVESSNLWRAMLRGDFGFSDKLALYARLNYEQNEFGGIDSRIGEGIGLAWRVIATDIDQLNLEGGFELVQQNNLFGANENFSALRAAGTFKHLFRANTYFFQEVEFLPSLDVGEDYRVNTETSLVAAISTHFAVKASYKLRFDNLPSLNATGTESLRKSDRIFSTGIQLTY